MIGRLVILKIQWAQQLFHKESPPKSSKHYFSKGYFSLSKLDTICLKRLSYFGRTSSNFS